MSHRIVAMQIGPNPYAPPTADVDFGVAAVPGQEPLADAGRRLAATMIDGVLASLAMAPALALYLLLDRAEAWLVAALTVPALYVYQWYLVATSGQSLAKRWLGIKVVKTSGRPVDFASGVVARVWVPAMIGFTPVGPLFGLTDALFIFREDRRCIHDLLAGTKVIATA
jgi:uncharacterized RDD family membrane protein YckC